VAVDVLLFGPARDCVDGDTVLSVPVALPAPVSELVDALAAGNDALAELLPCCAIAVGDEVVARDFVVSPGDEVAVLPPVSGGC
jgi:molybdopterin converting factor small subunit